MSWFLEGLLYWMAALGILCAITITGAALGWAWDRIAGRRR